MAEVLLQIESPIVDRSGDSFSARVCGRPMADGLWEGWIEFHPTGGGTPLRTPRETEQPNRPDLEYWATGLTTAYLEGALGRARNSETPDLRPRTVVAEPAFEGPAERKPEAGPLERNRDRPRAVLNPFEVYRQGEDVLLEELSALSEGHLRNIVRHHDFDTAEEAELGTIDRARLTELILSGVKRRS